MESLVFGMYGKIVSSEVSSANSESLSFLACKRSPFRSVFSEGAAPGLSGTLMKNGRFHGFLVDLEVCYSPEECSDALGKETGFGHLGK